RSRRSAPPHAAPAPVSPRVAAGGRLACRPIRPRSGPQRPRRLYVRALSRPIGRAGAASGPATLPRLVPRAPRELLPLEDSLRSRQTGSAVASNSKRARGEEPMRMLVVLLAAGGLT